MKHLFLWISIGIMSCCCLSCEAPQKPEFKYIKNVKLSSLKDTKISLTGDVILNNPNPFGMTLTATDLDVSIDGKKAGNVKQTFDTEIPASADFVVPVKIDLDQKIISGDWLNTAMSFLFNQKVKVHYKGYVTVKALEIPIDIPIDNEEEVTLRK
ncbi:MAG: LEA type 2 family protein [Chitinophagales bacterium]